MGKTKNSRDDQNTSSWTPLSQKKHGDMLFHGSIIRCIGKWPYENIVDFMVLDGIDKDRGVTIIVSSGYKAGLILVNLPKESEKNDDGYDRCLIPSPIDQNPCAHCRIPMDIMRHG
jgi:hypothetical protein